MSAQSVLVVDDEAENFELVSACLEPLTCEVFSVSDGEAALRAIARRPPDVLLLDISMPGIDGLEVCRRVKLEHGDRLPVVLVSSRDDVATRVRGLEVGADDFIAKPFEPLELRARTRSLLSLKRYRDRLDEADSVICSLARAVEARHPATDAHGDRVAALAVRVGAALGLRRESLDELRLAATVHDVGKIGLPDDILDKPGPLSAAEFGTAQSHAAIGAEILAPLRSLADLAPVVRHHHEHYDGTGYPDGLAGEEIPLGARLLAVCDTWDALTSDRAYRRALPHAAAAEVLRRGAGSQWDPRLVSVLLDIVLASTQIAPAQAAD